MSRRHADNWSRPGHYLDDPYTWPWSPNGHGHEWRTAAPFVQCQSALPFGDTAILTFLHENPWSTSCVVKGQGHVWPLKFKGQGYGQGQTHWSHLRPGVQSICLLFILWQSDHFWLRYSKFHIWPWKSRSRSWSRLNPMVTFEPPEFNRYVCFSFRGNRTIFGWDVANSIFDLGNTRSRSWSRSKPMVTFEPQSSIDMFAFRFVAIGPFWLRYSKFHIWPWKILVKITTKIDQNLVR